MYATCKERTGAADGMLMHKVCPKTPKLPKTIGPKCDPGCDKHKGEWYGDGVCDFNSCQNCESFYERLGDYDLFDKGDCVGEPEDPAPCGDGCKKFKGEWMGDGICDGDCLGCQSWWSNKVFDKGDCKKTDSEVSVGQYMSGPDTGRLGHGHNGKLWYNTFDNPDGQKCTFKEINAKLGGVAAQNCGWNGADKAYQEKLFVQDGQDGCAAACRARQWCNYAWADSNSGHIHWDFRDGYCYMYATCKERTGAADGMLMHKVCPKTPKLPKTIGPKCDPGCDKHKGEWYGDGVCDFNSCQNCESFYERLGDYDLFDKGDCVGEPEDPAPCGDGCKKFKGEWMGDGICDGDCLGCQSWWSNGVFDKGDCTKAAEYSAVAAAAPADAPGAGDMAKGALALVGLGTVLYGAAQFYCKKE